MLWGISLSYVTEIERKLEKKKKKQHYFVYSFVFLHCN